MEKYREMIPDAAETVLSIFGFDGTVIVVAILTTKRTRYKEHKRNDMKN